MKSRKEKEKESEEEAVDAEENDEETHFKETIVEETVFEETHVEETNVEETHVEETHVEETHVEETQVEETQVEETHVEETLDNLLLEDWSENTKETQSNKPCLQVCMDLKKSNNAMHKCKYCLIAVSQNCPCNVEDPDSDNAMHRMHKSRDLCGPSREKTCPRCGKKAKLDAILKCHMEAFHPKYNCEDCDSKFNNLEDFKNHKEFHLELRPRKKQRINLIENEDSWDVDPLEDSMTDKNFELTKEDQETLNEDEEYDFAFKCASCSYETNLEKDLKHHLKWNHNLKKNIQKALTVKKDKNTQCEHCQKQFSRLFNLRRHQDKFHPM